MATYRITAPNGRTYEVQGPAGATQAQVQAIVQGQMVQAARIRQQKANAPLPKKKPSAFMDALGTAQGGISSFLDGVLPGAAGVAGGVGAALGSTIAAPLSDKVDFDPIGAFREGRRTTEQNTERFKKDHSTLATVGTGAGMVAGIAIPVSKLGLGANAAKATLLRRAGNAALNAGAMGAASGAASSHADSVGGFVGDTVRGGIIGGGTGLAIPYAGRALKAAGADVAAKAVGRRIAPLVRKAGEALPGTIGRNLENRANVMSVPRADLAAMDHVGRKIDQGGTTPYQVQEELERRTALGVEPVIADVNESLRSAYGSAARQPGEATMAARRAIDQRQRAMTQRVRETHIPETLGPTGNIEKQSQALTAQAKYDAAPLYATSNAQNVPYVNELKDLMKRPIAKAALNDAAINLQNQGLNPAEMGMIQGYDGVWEIGPKPTMETWDYFKTALDRQVFAGKQPFAPLDVTRDMRGAIDTRGRLLDIMDGNGSGPTYRPSPPPGPDVPPTNVSPYTPQGPGVPPGQQTIEQGPLGLGGPPAPPAAPVPQAPGNALPSPDATGMEKRIMSPEAYPQDAQLPPMDIPRGPDRSGEFLDMEREFQQVPPTQEAGLPVPIGGQVPMVQSRGSTTPRRYDPQAEWQPGRRLDPEPEAVVRDRSSAIPPEGLNPYWKPAREAYAGPTQDRQALELGQEMARSNATDIGNRMEGMTGSQIPQFSLGQRTGIADDVATLGDYGNAARRVDGSLKHREAIIRGQGADNANALFDRLDAEHQGYQTYAAIRGNSMTAGREAEDAIQAQEMALANTGQGLWSLATGRPMAAARHLAAGFSGEPVLTKEVNQKVAAALSDMNPETVAETLKDVRRATTVRKAGTKRAIARDSRTGRLFGSRAGAGLSTPDELDESMYQ